jgi:hypothetical protein
MSNNRIDLKLSKPLQDSGIIHEFYIDNDDKLAGEIYVSEIAIEEVVNQIIDQKRLGLSINNNKNGN